MATTGGVEHGGGEDPSAKSGPLRGDGPPAAGAERAAAARPGAAESEEERERAGPPLGEQLPGGGYNRGAERTRGRERAPWRDTGNLEEKVAGCRRGKCQSRRRWGRRARRAEEPAAQSAWEWILLALCLWSALLAGAALVLKGNRVEGEVFAFDALRCDNSHAQARY